MTDFRTNLQPLIDLNSSQKPVIQSERKIPFSRIIVMKSKIGVIWFLLCCFFIVTPGSHLLADVSPTSPCPGNFAVFSPGADADRLWSAQPASSVMLEKGFLLFFMNPNGRPCQIQSRIIEENRADIEKRYVIKYIMTTKASDHALFYRFGVRALPAVILLNSNGTLNHRFPPGILSREQILGTANN